MAPPPTRAGHPPGLAGARAVRAGRAPARPVWPRPRHVRAVAPGPPVPFMSEMRRLRWCPERAILARLTYQRALAAARVAPTPRRWRKLVAAARNLRASDRERELAWLARLPAGARERAVARVDAARRGPVLLALPVARRGRAWPELVAEWERARSLVEWSERLVAQARGLCAELGERAGGGVGQPAAAPPGRPRARGTSR